MNDKNEEKLNNKKSIFKRVANSFYGLVLIVLVMIAGLAALSAFGLPKQLRVFVVQTGSMSPTIRAGSLIFVRPEGSYGVGDVVTFKAEAGADIKNPKLTVTHRIAAVAERDGTQYYTTKGDANESADAKQTYKELVLGKVVAHVPYIGYPVGFAKTQLGFVLLIVIPATIIVYSEILTIKREVKEKLAKRRERKMEVVDDDLTEEEEA